MNIKDKCLYLETSKIRLNEVELGLNDKGKEAFELMGCYNCNGYDILCPYYEKIKTNDYLYS